MKIPRFMFSAACLLGPFKPENLSRSRIRLFGNDHYVSINKALEVGFTPEVHLQEGITRTVKWYRTEGFLDQ